ncbi:Uncharacterised protein [Vibrio cholerae]|nr:Uncharacterised protein [Vibrio cholerae]CSD39829.1 Uncharacterised protein [Vibrio cholerae]
MRLFQLFTTTGTFTFRLHQFGFELFTQLTALVEQIHRVGISKVVTAFKQIRQCKNLRFELLQCLVRLLVLLLQRIKLLWVGIEYRRHFFQLADGAAMRSDKGFCLTQLLQFLFKLLVTGFERLFVK